MKRMRRCQCQQNHAAQNGLLRPSHLKGCTSAIVKAFCFPYSMTDKVRSGSSSFRYVHYTSDTAISRSEALLFSQVAVHGTLDVSGDCCIRRVSYGHGADSSFPRPGPGVAVELFLLHILSDECLPRLLRLRPVRVRP
ncbi:hypothetical protein TGDOM2_357420 [Toxoplasma gondii GAB2-2007-GAL-DOM2]|uniref:Uncharacterized protein n=2 Tax=Toxoplasma gondii TaxID=5811 RepID=A0A2T6ID15_TOXGO|nr:hypothetical protein TGDOM2_357420 [Toxoplasma gondii GAB2-2007-GAL-DOM2]PUA83227.1 hypothetical protein TGBR9_357420 [Toxoplasma gondii TgCATBr9]